MIMSKNKYRSTDKFMDYFYKKLSYDELYNKNNINKIHFNKAFLFKDFVRHLLQVIEDTFLNTEQFQDYFFQKNHFDWCWYKTIDYFYNDNILFFYEGEHYDYFLEYIINCFYKHSQPLEEMDTLKNFWENVMTLDEEKTESEYDIFIDVYFILNNHLKIDK